MTTLKFLQRETASLAFTGRLGQHCERRKRRRRSCSFRAAMSAAKFCLALRIALADYSAARAQVRASLRKFSQSRDNGPSAVDETVISQIGESGVQSP